MEVVISFLVAVLAGVACHYIFKLINTDFARKNVFLNQLYNDVGFQVGAPEYLCLSEEFFDGRKCAVEVKVTMIYKWKKGDIIDQYVTFTWIYNNRSMR